MSKSGKGGNKETTGSKAASNAGKTLVRTIILCHLLGVKGYIPSR